MDMLSQLESIPLSDGDIIRKLRGKTKLLLYHELADVSDIDDILVNGSAVILYERKPKNGHWVCIVRYMNNNRPTIEFFDSYGMFPDDEKKHIDDEFLALLGQKFNKIADLLLKASGRYRIEFNDSKLQKWSPKINTCGRHVISRIILKTLTNKEYNRFMRSFNIPPDDVATIICEVI